MKKVKNLNELVELIGMESVEKCFTEYMMLMIAKAKKYDELNIGKPEKLSYVYKGEFVLAEKHNAKRLLNQLFEATGNIEPLSDLEIKLGELDTFLGDNRRCVEIHFKTDIDIEAFNLYDKLRQSLFETCHDIEGIAAGDTIEEDY